MLTGFNICPKNVQIDFELTPAQQKAFEEIQASLQ